MNLTLYFHVSLTLYSPLSLAMYFHVSLTFPPISEQLFTTSSVYSLLPFQNTIYFQSSLSLILYSHVRIAIYTPVSKHVLMVDLFVNMLWFTHIGGVHKFEGLLLKKIRVYMYLWICLYCQNL